MPELPEVETAVRYLRERVCGRTITSGEVLWPRSVYTHKPEDFVREVSGLVIKDVSRRGKYICLETISKEGANRFGRFIFVHLRMSGSLDVISNKTPLALHDRVILKLDNGKGIRFDDPRKFGRVYLSCDPQSVVGALGVEPLSSDFTPQLLGDLLKKRRTAIKRLLLDQSIVAGLGNIYVDESLWLAKIHPLKQANTVSRDQVGRLHEAIRSVLGEAIELLGTDFGDGVVDGGMYVPKVYGREGKGCSRCEGVIVRIVVGQRGTHYCRGCQRKRG
jgi:formamidopyrimidine-DNA glycosylase